MRVVVETPKWSFTKYHLREGRIAREFLSPFPTPFNYGFVKGTVSDDGMPRDAIILGGKLRQGVEVEATDVGNSRFIDCGLEDDKVIASTDGKIGFFDKAMLDLFFTAYMAYKTVYHLVGRGKLVRCRYGGSTLSPRPR